MKRFFALGLAAVIATQVFCADDKVATLNGAWNVIGLEQDGVKLPADQVNAMQMVLTMKDGKFTVKMGTNEIDKGSFKAVDANGLDIESSQLKGKPILSIYKLEGDTLTVCYDLSGASRPKEYASKAGTQTLVEIYKRAGK